MLKTHFFTLILFFTTMVALTLVLYLLSCVLFSTGIEDELQIERLYAYECGYSSFSDARDAFDIKFYLVAVLFLIFDLEISFLFPMAVTLQALGIVDYLTALFFLIILTIGFVYEWKKGAMDW
jgi:NADH:ubiquinone oxidoreductase subunit 3 (subunit A)